MAIERELREHELTLERKREQVARKQLAPPRKHLPRTQPPIEVEDGRVHERVIVRGEIRAEASERRVSLAERGVSHRMQLFHTAHLDPLPSRELLVPWRFLGNLRQGSILVITRASRLSHATFAERRRRRSRAPAHPILLGVAQR